MNRILAPLLLAIALPLSAIPALAHAIEDSDRGDPQLLYSAMAQIQDDAFSLDYGTQREDSLRLFLAIAEEARVAQLRFAQDPAQVRIFSEREGVFLFYASEYHEFDDDDHEGRLRELGWLVKSVAAIERSLVPDLDPVFPFYEYRSAAAQLFDQAAWLGDPRLADFAASSVRANRLSLARYATPDGDGDGESTAFEKNMLAQSLYQLGYLTDDAARIAEANALADELGSDATEYSTQAMRDAMAEGNSPFPAPGNDY